MPIIEERVIKETPFNENPRRHFDDIRHTLYGNIIDRLIKEKLLTETLTPTGKTSEYTMTITLQTP